jgi:hypothetical protein
MITDVGQKWKETFELVSSGAGLSSPIPEGCDTNTLYDCQYQNVVLANDTGEDIQNDKTPFWGLFQNWTTSAVFTLQKKTGGTFIDKATLNNSDYGVFSPMGTFTDFPKYTGYTIHWSDVLDEFNEGIYRVKVVEINPLNPSGKTSFSVEYCLKTFNCNTWENTVRLEWYSNGKLGNINDDKEVLNFGTLNLYNQLRVSKSIFGYPKSTYEEEEIQYTNGEFERVKYVQTEKYTLDIGRSPSYIHDIIKTYAIMGDNLMLTDYSSNNPATFVQKAVRLKSGYEPRWSKQNKCAPVTIELEPTNNRLEIDKC